MVTLHTIDGGTVNAINDALLYDFIIGQNGIATGATVTSEGALLLHIDSGWGVIKGRIFSIEAETISATPSTSGTVKGRLLLQIDITNTTNPIVFVTQAAATLPALQQEDINGNGTIYQLPIATYDVNEVAVSNLQMVAPVVEAINNANNLGGQPASAYAQSSQFDGVMFKRGWAGAYPSITVPLGVAILFIQKSQYDQSSIWNIDNNGASRLLNPIGDTVTYHDNGDHTMTLTWSIASYSNWILMYSRTY